MKKLIAIILAGIMMLSLAACGGGGTKANTVADNEPLTKDDVIQIATISHASWPYREDWKVWQYIEEECGATLQVNAYPSSDVVTKYSLMLASPDSLPDVMVYSSKPNESYIGQGAFVAFDDMVEYMPSFNAWMESLTEDEYKNNVATRKSYDGKIYYAPVIGREVSQNVRAWLYRKDIFEKHNLAVPTTYDELYEVCKTLKGLYPESYPFAVRSGIKGIDMTGPSWKEYWTTGIYYDYNAEKWSYGATEDIMLDVLTFYKKMVDEKLVMQDFITINTASWQELITTDRGFILPDYQTRIDFFNGIARMGNPGFDLHAMVPPIANSETGVAMVNKYNVDPQGMVMCNSGDAKRMANAAKYLDWFYTDEAMELVSWGKEGETYEVKDGKKVFISDETGAMPNTLYGISTSGVFTRMDPAAIAKMDSADIAETRDMVLEHTMPYANPAGTLSFNEEEQRAKEDITTAMGTYTNEMLTKFILGQEPLSKFAEFQNTLDEMGLSELLKAYESAYARVK
ncbi:MAG: extracellular solute-binding protein [Ruminococcaceae bacterium]|nr:extracellular solute-binding protein [Oscillospiraceae bacterium]